MYHIKAPQKNINSQKGFTLLFSVLVATLVVAIGASIISIALRQTILSGTSRESQYAFYAANTMLECVFYWDIMGGGTEAGRIFPAKGETESAVPAICSGGNIKDRTGTGGFDDPNGFITRGLAEPDIPPTDPGSETRKTVRMVIQDKSSRG